MQLWEHRQSADGEGGDDPQSREEVYTVVTGGLN